MTSIHNLSSKEENDLFPGISSSDSNHTSENSTLDREKKNKIINRKLNKKVCFYEIQIIYIESYKKYNQSEVTFERTENNIVKSCNCVIF